MLLPGSFERPWTAHLHIACMRQQRRDNRGRFAPDRLAETTAETGVRRAEIAAAEPAAQAAEQVRHLHDDRIPADVTDRYLRAMDALRRAADGPASEVNLDDAVKSDRMMAMHQLDTMETAAAWSVGDDMASERRDEAESAWRALWDAAASGGSACAGDCDDLKLSEDYRHSPDCRVSRQSARNDASRRFMASFRGSTQ